MLESVSDWREDLVNVFRLGRSDTKFHLLGVGNPIRRDDGVGVFIAEKLEKKFGLRPTQNIRIHFGSSPELIISKTSEKTRGRLLIFDSVERNAAPGSIVLGKLASSRFGYFATHNVPLKVIPTLHENMDNLFILGIEPETVDIGEGLSLIVEKSAQEVIEIVSALIQEQKNE